ncbi:hypothetical protein [Lusitaniella coriacea]|nr:hypothetical protein [Lusitaniella coriacea]
MSIDVFWCFFKIKETDFLTVQSEFEQATQGCPNIPEVPTLTIPQNPTIPVSEDYANSVLECMLAARELSLQFYHDPFHSMAYRKMKQEIPLFPETFLEIVMQSRIAPPAILLMGIGRKRFSKLPGYLGNMLIHSTEVERTLESVSHMLHVDWESYFERAKLILGYIDKTSDRAAIDVLEILQVLPRALEKAKNEEVSLLALTSWGCP